MSRVVFYDSDGNEVEVGTITYTRKQTNADRIRGMSDDELAILLDQTALNAYEYGTGMRENIKNTSVSDWLDWLKQEV